MNNTERSGDAVSLPEELMKKIEELEADHSNLKEKMSKLMIARNDDKSLRNRSSSVSPQRSGQQLAAGGSSGDVGGIVGPAAVNFRDNQYLNILQSMGQSVHVIDVNYRIIYWNKGAEYLYGWSPSEALGKDALKLLTYDQDFVSASDIIHRVITGESWTGKFPVKNKRGERFIAVVTDTPFYDDDKILIGIICISVDIRPFRGTKATFSRITQSEGDAGFNLSNMFPSSRLGLDIQQPLQTAATKISNLASRVTNKVKLKMRAGENIMDEGGSGDIHHSDDAGSSGGSTPRGDVHLASFGSRDSGEDVEGKLGISKTITSKAEAWMGKTGEEVEGKPGISKMITSKAEAWMGKKSLSWPWKGNEQQEGSDTKSKHFGWSWMQAKDQPTTSTYPSKTDSQETTKALNIEVSSHSSPNSSTSSCGSSNSAGGATNKGEVDGDSYCEISWDELAIGEHIGEGSCGNVYHAMWNESDVAVKVFSKQEYSDDVILSFKQEVALMKRLRHPNILLFMGAVTAAERLCIVIEFLPRGSLFRLIHKNLGKIDLKRKTQMALDIAKGVHYLHSCHPPIIHRDLKSSNLLVDKNWSVKVGDFGLSKIKHEAYLITKTGKGTPQWMAPEVIRNDPSDEKSDVYSFGVVLWELATEKIPWDDLTSMQVIGAVGFMDQRLDIPQDVDPQWASLIESCWHREPKNRPNFQELLQRLRDINRSLGVQLQSKRAIAASSSQKEAKP